MPKAGATRGKKHGAVSALDRALRFETTGRKFFASAAQKSADPYASRIFLLLSDMEERHYRDIQAIAQRLEETGRFPAVSTAPHEERMLLFRREHRRIRKEKTLTGDAAAAMRRALGFEAEGREMYLRLAERAAHPQEKKFFRLLSAEEQSHFNVIYEYLDALEDTGLRMNE